MSVYIKTKKDTGRLSIVGVLPELTNSSPHNLGKNAYVGDNNDCARSDHIHKFPALSDIGAASDSLVVHNTGNESISGTKTFNNIIYSQTPPVLTFNGNEVTTTQFVESYVIENNSSLEKIYDNRYIQTGNANQTIDGIKSFSKNTYFNDGITVSSNDITALNSTLTVNKITITENESLDGTIKTLISSKMGTDDNMRIATGATAKDSGFLEIATADNGQEPIYIRQYTNGNNDSFNTIVNELTLLDSSGNTTIPNNLTVNGEARFNIAYIPIKVNSLSSSTSSKTITISDWNTMIVTNSNYNITFPKLGSSYNGLNVYIKNLYTSPITLSGSSCKIDGLSSTSLGRYECILAVTDGTNWFCVDTSARFQ